MNTTLEKRLGIVAKTVIALILLANVSITLADEELVGSDGGSISVGNSGQAAWSMPVEVPSGINGVAPNLALSVSTGGGNGSLGVGGGLSGLSGISRCGRTIHQDGYFQSPQFEIADAYCLDGARLVLENGAYGVSGSVYRTEIESFQRIKAHGNVAGKGPAYFEVTNRNGATSFYGKRATTRDVDSASGAVSVWKIDQLIDSNTNTLHYHYGDISGNNEVQLTHISYGGNTDENVSEHLSVHLLYETRPDTFTTWSRGERYSQSKRISRIQTKVGDTLVKDYRLSYQQGAVTGASRLSAVQLCAGNGDCYRKTHFEYADETHNTWQTSSLSLPASAQSADGKPLGTLVDINNDGKSDWVRAFTNQAGVSSIQTWLGGNTGWVLSASFALPDVLTDFQMHSDGFAKGMLLDVNGDGWPDYVQAYASASGTTLKTWRNTGSSFVLDNALTLPIAISLLESNGKVRVMGDLADLNADGLVDVVQSIRHNGNGYRKSWIQYALNGQHSWQPNASYQPPSYAYDYIVDNNDGQIHATLFDVNGDGLDDWIHSYRVNGIVRNFSWLNTGLGFATSPDSNFNLPSGVALFNYDLISNAGVAEYTFTDLNGDGLPDLSKAININGADSFDSWIHTGLTWQQDSRYNVPVASTLVSADGTAATLGGLIDLNSDGQPDYVQSYQDATTTVEGFWLFDPDSKTWGLSGDYDLPFINNTIQADGASVANAEIADLNHDGYPELLNTSTGAVFETQQGEHYPGTLVRTVSPLGGVTELYYGVSTDPSVYELSEQSAYPNVAYNAPVRVVKEISASNGIGGMISAIHKYGNAKTNVLGQGGLGYEYHVMRDGNTQVEVSTTFHQTYPYAGRIKASTKRLGTRLLSESSSQMEVKTITRHGVSTRYPHPNDSIAKTFDLDGALIKIARSTSDIDDYGNAHISTESIYDANDNLVRRSTKQVDYKAPDTARWLFGLPERATSTLYDVASNKTYVNVAIAEFASDGKPKNETLEPESNQWVKKAYQYDGFGNRYETTVTAAGILDSQGQLQERTSTTTFTSDGRFPKTVKNALNHEIKTTFDPILAKPLTVTDANGIVKEFVYDGFGTVVKESKAHQDNGATRGRQIVLPKWCIGNPEANCPDFAAYFIAAFDDEGEAPEIAYYDINGKELRKQTFGFGGKVIAVETQYNANGQVAKVSQPFFMDEETPTWTEYSYDVLGRQTHRVNAEDRDFYTRYQHLTVETENPGNNDTPAQISRVVNNIFGQPLESIDPDGFSTRYVYDGRGKLIQTIDAKGNTATISYDDTFGRKTAMDDPDLGQWVYEYDSLGNLIAQTDAIGQRTELTYDILNRLVRRVDDVGGAKQEITSWEYSETKGNGDVIGGLTKVISPGYERQLKYDDLSRMMEATSTIGTDVFTQRTGYHGTADKVDWVQYPSGLAIRNTYDDYGFPKTVEGIELDHAKYADYQAASKELIRLQRDLEAYKTAHLNDADLFQLEEHERQVRRLGSALAEFYDEFDNNVAKQSIDQVTDRYTGLIERVQQKLTQHGNWHNIYQTELDTLYANIKDDLARLEEIAELSAPDQEAFNAAKALRDNYLSKENYYVGKINQYGKVINASITDRNAEVERLNAQIAWLHSHIDTLFTPSIATIYKAHLDVMLNELDQHGTYLFNNYVNSGITAYAFSYHVEKIGEASINIGNHISNIEGVDGRIADLEKVITDNNWQWWYEHWSARRQAEDSKMATAAANIIQHGSEEAQTLYTRIQPDLDRINNWLAPITESHNNVIVSFNDRARAYVAEIAKQSGSYANRADLKSETFLKSFNNHVQYVRCLRDQSDKTSGDCYADTLVHVLNDDGSVDTDKQAEARGKVDDTALVDLHQFWSMNRYFCPVYYGYSCPSLFNTEIKQLAKTMHTQQCARMSNKQKENSRVPCDTADWNTTVELNDDVHPYTYPYLESGVAVLTNLNDFYTALVSQHQAEVARLVSAATLNTYNAETNYHDIIELGGKLWQASAPAELAPDDIDPREFVLLHKGEIHTLATSHMNAVAKEAERELKGHQYAIAQLINGTNTQSYDELYLAVQNQADTVDRLYKEIDQAYAVAANDDAFDDDDFNANKKIYWQAQDINAKGQIRQAKYGNGTVTQWTYDQFGRIKSHITEDIGGQSLLNNRYDYDAIGNLTQRQDIIEDVTEDFSYDVLNRLVQSDLSGSGAQYVAQFQGDVVNYEYDELGNLTYKSDIHGGGSNGHYSYGNSTGNTSQHAGPHAVTFIQGLGDFTYDNNGNQLSGNGRSITYSAFNKPTNIINGGQETTLHYGPERQLIQQQQPTPSGLETTKFVGGLFEQISVMGGGISYRHQIAVAGHAIAVVETKPSAPVTITKESYLHKNHQSSILAITDATGQVAERRYYDAFGDIKNHVGQASQHYAGWLAFNTLTSMAFTGHRTLIAAGVIHMGGRAYDATIGRFLSADPHIQAPLNSQSLNRYSYTLNNPLSWTDPSGYFFKSIFKALKKLFDKIKKIIQKVLKVVKKVLKVIAKVIKKIGRFVKKYARVIVAVVAAVAISVVTFGAASAAGWGLVASSVAAGAAGGAVSGLVLTGSLKGLLEGAALGALGGAIGAGLSSVGNGIANGLRLTGNVARNVSGAINASLTGGILGKLQGGSFSKGFRNGFIGFAAFSAVRSVGFVKEGLQKLQGFGKSLVQNRAEVHYASQRLSGQDAVDYIDDLPDTYEERRAIYEEGLELARADGLDVRNVEYVDGVKFSCEGCRQVDAFTNFDQAKQFALANSNFNLVAGTNSLDSITIYATATSNSIGIIPPNTIAYERQRFLYGEPTPHYNLDGKLNVYQTIVHEVGHNSNLNIPHGVEMHRWEYKHVKNHL